MHQFGKENIQHLLARPHRKEKKTFSLGLAQINPPIWAGWFFFADIKKNNVLCVLQNRELVMMMIVVEMMISPGTKVEEHDRIIK